MDKNPYKSPNSGLPSENLWVRSVHWSWPVYAIAAGIAVSYIGIFAFAVYRRSRAVGLLGVYAEFPRSVALISILSIGVCLALAYLIAKFSFQKMAETAVCLCILAILVFMLWPTLHSDSTS